MHMYIKEFEEKVPGKVGECIFDSLKCKSFQPIFAHFALLTLLCYVGKISEKIPGPNLDQILDPLLIICVFKLHSNQTFWFKKTQRNTISFFIGLVQLSIKGTFTQVTYHQDWHTFTIVTHRHCMTTKHHPKRWIVGQWMSLAILRNIKTVSITAHHKFILWKKRTVQFLYPDEVRYGWLYYEQSVSHMMSA